MRREESLRSVSVSFDLPQSLPPRGFWRFRAQLKTSAIFYVLLKGSSRLTVDVAA